MLIMVSYAVRKRNLMKLDTRTHRPPSFRLAYLYSSFRPSASREQRYLAYNRSQLNAIRCLIFSEILKLFMGYWVRSKFKKSDNSKE